VREQESLPLALWQVEKLHLCWLSEETHHVLGWSQEQGRDELPGRGEAELTTAMQCAAKL
jgi:hypothetical protein